MKRLAAFLALAVLLCGCNDTRRRNAFVESEDIRLQIGSTIQFRYDPLKCQLAFSRDRGEFRAQTDNTSDYYSIVLSEIPVTLGQRVSGDLTWTTETDILTRDDLDLEVLRIEADRIWLWSSSGRIGVVIRLLE